MSESATPQIMITGLKLDNHKVSVPVGLSELLQGCWVEKQGGSDVLKGYDRKVLLKNNRLVTVLTKERVKEKPA
jgi:hypothetical protein